MLWALLGVLVIGAVAVVGIAARGRHHAGPKAAVAKPAARLRAPTPTPNFGRFSIDTDGPESCVTVPGRSCREDPIKVAVDMRCELQRGPGPDEYTVAGTSGGLGYEIDVGLAPYHGPGRYPFTDALRLQRLHNGVSTSNIVPTLNGSALLASRSAGSLLVADAVLPLHLVGHWAGCKVGS